MATALVGGAFLSASLQVLFDRLASGGILDFILQRKTDEELLVKKLIATILSVEAILKNDAVKRTYDPAVREWLNELDFTVSDARNLLDEIAATDGSKNKPWRRTRIEMVRELLDRLEYMSGQNEGIDSKSQSHIPQTTSISVIDSSICGRVDDKEAIVGILLSDYPAGGDPTRVFAIEGVPGVGKTTLAKVVYNDNRVAGNFDLRVWVSVSSGPNVFTVTKTVFEAVTKQPCNIDDDLNLLQLRLKEEIIGKRLLIVLDDVWSIETDLKEWEVLRSLLRFCGQGSCLVITTRNEDVAGAIRTVPVYRLNPLPYEDCWVLFSRYAFNKGSSVADPGLEVIGRAIVKKCRGIPLAVKTLGILLRTKPDHEEWDRILKDEIWESSSDMAIVLQRLKNGIARGRDQTAAGAHSSPPLSSRPNCWRMRNIQSKRARLPLYCVLWLVVSCILSGLVFMTARKVHIDKMKEELSSRCDGRAKMLQDQFERHVNNTHTLAIFLIQLHRLHRFLDQKQREEFLRNYMLGTLHMHPFVEAVVVETSFVGGKRNSVMASQRMDIDRSALDMAPGMRDILKALATGNTTISRPFKRFDSRQVHFVMAYPVYKASITHNSTVDQRCEAAAGYMGALFRFDAFAEHVLGQVNDDGRRTISVSVFDATGSPDFCLLLYRSGNDGSSHQSLVHESELKLLGNPCRKYKITCRYQQKAPFFSWITIAFTGLTLVIVLLLGCLLLGVAVHSLKIQELEIQAEASISAYSLFRSEASRRIRKPAYTLRETLGVVLAMELSSPQRHYLRVAQEGCERLIALIREVLDRENGTSQIRQMTHISVVETRSSPQEQNTNAVP